MANNNADIELLAGLNLDSSEAEILRAIKILEQRIRNNEKAKISIDTKINERAIRSTIDKLQEMLKKKDLKIETKTSIEAISKEADAMLDVMESARRAAEEKLAFAEANRRVRATADDTADAINRERNAMNNLDDIDYILNNVNMTGQQGNSVFQQFGATLRDAFSTYTVANLLQDALYKVVDAGKEALATVKQFDDINVDLQMATGADKDYVKGLIADYAELGGELGALTDTVAESADSFLRQGRSMEDTNQLIRDSVILSKVAKIDGEKASEILTATINGFQLAASEGSRVNDVLSSIDLNSASDASGIGEALTKVASIANNTGVSLEKTAAMIATIKNATQDADTTIGTSLKTVLSRMNSIRANKFIDEETGEALNDVEKILGAIDVTMRDVNGQFKDAEIIIDEVGMKWKDLDSNTQKAVTTAMGGVYQANKLTALFDNYEQVIELTKIAEESQDQALKKFNDSYLPSLQAKTNALKSSLQSLATSTISDEFYASVLDSTKAIVDMTEESGILKGALAGLGTAGAVYAFQHLATYMRNATQEFANLGEAMQITRNANGTITDIQRLIDLTGGLSQSQTRLLLSTNNLTDAQKIAILMNQGVTQAEAQQIIQTWGVAAAQQGATSATITFSNALRGLWTTLMANPLVLISTAVTVGVTAFNKYKQELEETRQKNLEAGESAKECANNLEELYIEYSRLASIQDKTSTEEEAFKTVIEDVTKALGDKADALKDLKTDTDEYTQSLKEATKAELEEQYAKAKIGADAAKEALKDNVYDFWSMTGSQITILQDDEIIDTTENKMALDAVKDILKSYEDTSRKSIEWEPVNWDLDKDNMDAVVEYYNALVKARTKLVTADNADTLMDTEIYKDINSVIGKMSSSVEEYTKQQYNALKLQYEWQNGIPSTAEEFEAMENAILSASGAGEHFQQTLKDYLAEDFSGLYAKITDVLPDVEDDDTSAIPILSISEDERKALDDYTEKLTLITKLQKEWTNVSSADRMNLMSSISEQFSEYDLTGLIDGTKTLNQVLSELGQEAINQAKKNIQGFDSEIDSMFVSLFDKTEELNRSLADVETLEKALAKVQSGEAFDYEGADGILKLVSNFEELADAVLVTADGYSIEKDALIDLLNDSKTYTNELIALQYEYTKAYIEGYETRKAAILDEYNTKWGLLQSDIEDIYDEYQTKPLDVWDLIDKGYTTSDAEMIMRALSELTANEGNLSAMEGKLKEFEEKYKEFTNSINEANKNSNTSDTINFIDRLVTNAKNELEGLKNVYENATTFNDKDSALTNLVGSLDSYASALSDVYKKYELESNNVFLQIDKDYREAAKSGTLSIEEVENESTRKLIEKYWDYIDQYQNYYDEFLEIEKDIIEHKKQRFDLIKEEHDSITSLTEAMQDYKQSVLDYKEIVGTLEESDYYSLISSELSLKAEKQRELAEFEAEFEVLQKQGLDGAEWREKKIELINLEAEIYSCDKAIEEFKDSILEIRWDNFNKGIEQISNLEDEISDLITLMGDTSNFENGVITESGLTKLGLYAQQYVNAKKKVAEYSNAVEQLEVMYRNGLYSIDQYNEKLAELNDSQRESAIAMNEAKQSFINFREEALDSEIEKMQEVADKIKSALDAEKERQDYLESISDKQESISSLERRIKTLELSDDRKDIAEKLKLQQDLAEKRKELAKEQEQYAIDEQKKALDKQIENAEKAKESELENLRNNLDSQDALIQEYLSTVQSSYDTVYDNIQKISDEYGITFTESLVSPWESATNAAQLYADYVGQIMSQLDINTGVIDGVSSSSWIQRDNGKWQYKNSDGNYVKDDWVNDFGNRWYSFDSEGFMHENEWVDGDDGSKYYVGHNGAMCTGWNEIDGNHYYFDTNGKLMKDGYTPDGYVVDSNGVWDGLPQMPIEELKKNNVKFAHYAKGTLGVKKNQFAIVDENGEELILRTNEQGRPVFLENADGVLPHQLTKNIFEMAKNYNPIQNWNLPNLSNYKFPEVVRKSEPIVFEVNSPLVHVDGGLDVSMMGRLEKLMEKRVPNMVEHSIENAWKTRGLR